MAKLKGIDDNSSQDSQSHLSFSLPRLRSISGPQSYAIKAIEKKLIQLEERQHEVHTEKIVLDHLKHCPSVVRLYCTFHDSQRLYFVLEYLPNGSL